MFHNKIILSCHQEHPPGGQIPGVSVLVLNGKLYACNHIPKMKKSLCYKHEVSFELIIHTLSVKKSRPKVTNFLPLTINSVDKKLG